MKPSQDPEAPLTVGDVVRLNSYATRMTVRHVDGDKIVCRWHDQDDDLLGDDFGRRELTLIKRAGE